MIDSLPVDSRRAFFRCSYASYSLRETPERHVASPMDFIECNEYSGSWYTCDAADRPEGVARRLDILETHDAVFRGSPHVGDKGYGVLKQRVHGDALRRQSSPLEPLRIDESPGETTTLVRSPKTIPCYTLTGYKWQWTVYGPGSIPLHPAPDARVPVPFTEPNPQRIVFDVLRPTGFSAPGRKWTA